MFRSWLAGYYSNKVHYFVLFGLRFGSVLSLGWTAMSLGF